MTEDSKQRLLRYLTGNLSKEEANNEPQFEETKVIANNLYSNIESELEKQLNETGFSVEYNSFLQSNTNDSSGTGNLILYGTVNKFSSLIDVKSAFIRGFMAVLDSNFNILKIFTNYKSGSSIRFIKNLQVDSDGTLYGIDVDVVFKDGQNFELKDLRFIMLNNPTIETNNNYILELRQSYYLPEDTIHVGFNYLSDFLIKKDQNTSTYLMTWEDDGFYITTFKINVGSENEWTQYKYETGVNNEIKNLSTYISSSDDRLNLQIVVEYHKSSNVSGIDKNDYYIGILYNDGEQILYKEIKNIDSINSSSYSPPIDRAIFIQKDKFYYMYGSSYNDDGTNLYLYDNGDDQFIAQIDPNKLLYFDWKYVNGNLLMNYFLNYVLYNLILKDNILYRNQMEYIAGIYPTAIITNQYNLYTYYLQSGDNLYKTNLIYNSANYNGQPYENVNSLKPKSGRLLDNDNSIVFDRNLYNLSINQNTTTSTIEVPNTLLNDTEIATEQLVSENNNVIISNEEVYTKNIYEQLLINYINTLLISDANDINNIKTNSNASIRLNKSISDLLDYEDVKMTKYKLYYKTEPSNVYWDGKSSINWNEDSSEVWYKENETNNLPTPKFHNGVYTYEINIDNSFDLGTDKIEFISNDKKIIYLTKDLSNLEMNKTYALKQDVNYGIVKTSELRQEIKLFDAIDKEVNNVRINGYTRQITTTGQQLYNYKDTNTVTSGVTVDEDGWITATYDNTSGTSTKYLNYWTNNLDIEANTDYSIVAEIKKMNGSGWLAPVTTLEPTGGQFSQGWSNPFENLSTKTYKVIRKTRTSLEGTSYGLRSFVSFQAGQSGSITFRLSVLKDTTVTEDNFVYEQFSNGIPSPSPDYPQEVEVVRGNNYFPKIPSKTINGLTGTLNEDGSYTINGTATKLTDFYIDGCDTTTYKKLEIPSGNYFLTGSSGGSGTTYMLFIVKKKEDGSTEIKQQINNEDVEVLIDSSLTYRFFIRVMSGTKMNNIKLYPMLRKETASKEYEPYNSIVAKSNGKNLAKIDETNWALIDNIIKNKNINHNVKLTEYTFKANKTYTVCFQYFKKPLKNVNFLALKPDETIIDDYSFLQTINYDIGVLYEKQITLDEDTNLIYKTYGNDGNATYEFQFWIIEGTIATEYEPYQESKLTYGLNDNFLAEQDYIQDNKLYKNVAKVVLDGSEDWKDNWQNSTTPDYIQFYLPADFLNNNYLQANKGIALSNRFKVYVTVWTYNEECIGINESTTYSLQMKFKRSRISNLTEFKQWLSENPVEVYYQLETPTTIDLEPSGELKTYKDYTNISNNENTEMQVKYYIKE